MFQNTLRSCMLYVQYVLLFTVSSKLMTFCSPWFRRSKQNDAAVNWGNCKLVDSSTVHAQASAVPNTSKHRPCKQPPWLCQIFDRKTWAFLKRNHFGKGSHRWIRKYKALYLYGKSTPKITSCTAGANCFVAAGRDLPSERLHCMAMGLANHHGPVNVIKHHSPSWNIINHHQLIHHLWPAYSPSLTSLFTVINQPIRHHCWSSVSGF